MAHCRKPIDEFGHSALVLQVGYWSTLPSKTSDYQLIIESAYQV